MSDILERVKRGIRKPPKVIVKRLGQEVNGYFDRYLAPKRARRLTLSRLLKKTSSPNLSQLWHKLSLRPYFSVTKPVNHSLLEHLCPGEPQTIFEKAQLAMEHKVNLLGSGLISLGNSIDWHRDYKTMTNWPLNYMRDIDYNNLDRPSDVKFPWEVSRFQWLIPVGQAYLLTQEEHYALKVKELLCDWIEHNPYTFGINWACTMEVALRILSWTWLFHVFKDSKAWQDEIFQQKFLTSLYLHADFTERHLEFSDINGNHYTADAAGLVFAGLFFGENNEAQRWQQKGWDILCQELPRQVFEDGVDFEASIPYHRLVLELFFLPACYREVLDLDTPLEYLDRLSKMAEFSAAYTQPGGTVPLWGDADDARALPFGYQAINHHSYLCGLIGFKWHTPWLLAEETDSLAEIFWMFGAEAVEQIQKEQNRIKKSSCAFPKGGFYIMRNEYDHIFIDCGPLGLAGRGGHGHNDSLSFEAVLDGIKLISDCGAYVYTASYNDRNLFRSTSYHNTPYIDNQEINRFIRWDYLWNMHNDATSIVEKWQPGIEKDYFCGSHTGYHRLTDPVTPRRTITLEHQLHRLIIQDEIICKSAHQVCIPLHLAENVIASLGDDKNTIILQAGNKKFTLCWESSNKWHAEIAPARISPSYGITMVTQKLLWTAYIKGYSTLKIYITNDISGMTPG